MYEITLGVCYRVLRKEGHNRLRLINNRVETQFTSSPSFEVNSVLFITVEIRRKEYT
jgi:hypothetical protein